MKMASALLRHILRGCEEVKKEMGVTYNAHTT